MREVCNRLRGGAFLSATLVAVIAAAVAGCARPEAYHPVTGRITLDGNPLPAADVAFLPEGDQGAPSFGTTDAHGVYELRHTQSLAGAPVGNYSVRISTFREAKEDAETSAPAAVELVPARYNTSSELTAQVTDELKTFDFDLESGDSR